MNNQKKHVGLAVVLLAILAIATALYSHYYVHSKPYLAVAYAGDQALPGASWFPNAAETIVLAKGITDSSRKDFDEALVHDLWLVLFILLCMLSVAYLGWQRTASKRWVPWLVAGAVVAALSDGTENILLHYAFSPGASTLWARGAAVATTFKWTFYYASSLLALLVLCFAFGPIRDWAKALFIDVPYLIDSAARRFDFRLHREYDYNTDTGQLSPQVVWKKPSFWFFVILVGFLSYGPTPDGLCTIVLADGAFWLLWVGVALLVITLLLAVYWFRKGIRDRMDRRAGRQGATALAANERRPMVWAAMVPCGAVLLAPIWAAGIAMLVSAQAVPCADAKLYGWSILQLILCVIAVAAFAVASSSTDKTNWLLWWQAGIVSALACLQWFWLVHTDASEARNVPYRHLFTWLISAMCIVLCFAPCIAQWWLKQAKSDASACLQQRLTEVELFNPDRSDPTLSPGEILHAVVQGIVYHPLQVFLPPSLLALMAPQHWLAPLVAIGLLVSLFLRAWGSISQRWQHLVMQVDRWLMSGLAFPVSLCVIAVGMLRLMGVQYVSTILDAAPFGAVFSVVLMSYVLFWLVEYWLDRTAAFVLLGMLGAKNEEIRVAYQPSFQRDPKITVDLQGRYLMSHGLGHFLVVGRLVQDQPPRPTSSKKPDPAFHSYTLLGLFSELLKAAGDEWRLQALVRSTHLYFYSMNLLVILVVLGFGITYLILSKAESAQPVVEANAETDEQDLKDLVNLIVADDNTRPAVVVAASGGGTRAALYTAHVLQGLHRIGVDRDIVLLSGVSGGAASLTYFAANYDALIKAGSEAWYEFRNRVSKPYIQDVIEGAFEWRIFGTTPLTVLLAESFKRRLLPVSEGRDALRFSTLHGAPALILNTTIVGHPIEDSQMLLKVLNAPMAARDGTPKECSEQQRPYNVLSGGRLIFTDLKLTSSGRTRALARCIPWSRRCILDTPSWACRQYIPREIWPHRQRHQRWLH